MEETVAAAADSNVEGCFGVSMQGTVMWDQGLRGGGVWGDPQSVLQLTRSGPPASE